MTKKIKRSQLVNIIKEEMMRMNENIFCNYNRQNESKEDDDKDTYRPSDAFEGYAVDGNGIMSTISSIKSFVDYASTHPEYCNQLPPIFKKELEDCKKFIEEYPEYCKMTMKESQIRKLVKECLSEALAKIK